MQYQSFFQENTPVTSLFKNAALAETGDALANTNTTASMSVGDTFDGRISSTGDTDWISIDLVAGEDYVFTMWGIGGSSSGLADTIIRIYGPNGVLLGTNDDLNSSLTFSGLSFTANSTGTYYIEADGFGSNIGNYRIQASEDEFTPTEIARYVTQVDWGFRAPFHFDVQAGGTLTYNISGLTAEGRQLAEWALETWSLAMDITFVQTNSSAAHLIFDDNQNGAFAGPAAANPANGVITQSTINVGLNWLNSFGTTIDSESFNTYLHEIGHALGLGHAGPYDGFATYGNDNLYANDSTMLTIMSYFGPSENTTVTGSNVIRISPMIADHIAIRMLYGNSDSYLGDTVWGANSNVGGWLGDLLGILYDGDATNSSFYGGNNIGYTIRDNGGIDTVDLSTTSVAQRIDLRDGRFSDIDGLTNNVSIAIGSVIENVIGGSGNDNIRGNTADNRIEGGAGDDTVNGGGGTDTAVVDVNRSDVTVTVSGAVTIVTSSLGTDRYENVEFFQFNDQLVSLSDLQNGTGGGSGGGGGGGGGGTPLNLTGDGGPNLLVGGPLADTLAGGGGNDTLLGGADNDQIAGSDGNDSIEGNDGDDNIGGGLGDDTIDGGNGNDTVGAGRGNDSIEGGAGNDGLFAGSGLDVINGGAGNDNIGAGFGNDTLDGGSGNDNMGGGTGRDLINAGAGDDTVGGGEGDDTIDGGIGDDFLAGGGRHDSIDGGAGNDRINGGLGSDTMTGGTGADTFIFVDYGAGQTDIITDFEDGVDMLRLTGVVKAPGSGLQGFVDALNITNVAGGAEFSYEGNTVFLAGVNANDLGIDDFIFV